MDDHELKNLLTAVQCGKLSVGEAASKLRSGCAAAVPPSADDSLLGDEVQVIETHIDDMNPEILGFLMERLLEEGALDVAYSPLQMKKNRPAVKLTVITHPCLLVHLSRLILLESTTIGIRHYPAYRLKLERIDEERQTSLGPVRVKVLRESGTTVRVVPEYEECLRLARENGIPLAKVYRTVERETGPA